jgi:hypothetical protein
MSGKDSVFAHTLQQEIDDLRAQALLLPAGRKRNVVLARADRARSHNEGVLVGCIPGPSAAAMRY